MAKQINEPVDDHQKIKLFERWDFDGIEVKDLGLQKYISLGPIYFPYSGGRHEHQRFEKSKINIVERLTNNLMRHGRNCGKKAKAISIIKMAFEIVHLRTGANPIAILVNALENTAPSEDTTRIGYGGIVYHRAVDISPQRRVDLALRFLTNGSRRESFSSPRPLDECIAEELILASNSDIKSNAIQRRHEMERVALASR